MRDFRDKSVDVYKNLAKVPSLDSALVITGIDSAFYADDNILHWQANWSCGDISRNVKSVYTSSGTITFDEGRLQSIKHPFISATSDKKLVSISQSNLQAVLKDIEIKDEKRYFLEIWNRCYKVSSIDLTKEGKHGIVHMNSVFGCLNWSNGSDRIVYVAEKKLAKSKSFFDNYVDSNSSHGHIEIGREFVYREDWGEQLVGTHKPSLFIYDVNDHSISDLSTYIPDYVSIGCAVWSKDDKFLYILGWNGAPWKLGMIYEQNRYSTLFKLDVNSQELTCLTDGKSSIFSPMLNPGGEHLIYLQSVAFGPHRQCVKLCCLNVSQEPLRKPSVVVDVIHKPLGHNCFQGLYVNEKRLRNNCWLSNGHELIVSSLHRSNLALLCINISTGKVKLLETEGAWTILRVANDVLFASYSTPNTPPVFKAGRYNDEKIEWIDIDAPVCQLEDVNWEIVKHEPVLKNEDYPGLDYESVLVKPLPDVPIVGLIVNPHGGPHSCFVSGFDVFTAAFRQLGFAVLRVNYRGSIGFGQDNVNSLPKNIGYQDVSDVQHAAETVAKDLGIPTGQIFVYGGSHGGFLTLHLIGQYPDFYNAAAVRNPVVNVASMRSSTDVMDWCYVEGGGEFSYGCVPTSEVIKKHLKCSPIVHVSSVRTPLLFMLGLADRQVHSSQSLEYVHALQGLGRKVMVLGYDGNNHSINKVNANADRFVNMTLWFIKHQW